MPRTYVDIPADALEDTESKVVVVAVGEVPDLLEGVQLVVRKAVRA